MDDNKRPHSRRDLTDDEKLLAQKVRAVWDLKKAELNLTQQAVAEKLNMRQGAFTQFLNGSVPIPDSLLINLSIILNYPLHRLSKDFSDKLSRLTILTLKGAEIPVMHAMNKGQHPTTITIDAPTSWGTDSYGVYVDTMEYEPYAEPGQFIIVSAMTAPRLNQKVFINTHEGPNQIGKLLRRDKTTVTLAHLITGAELTIPINNINNIHTIKGVVSA